MIQTWAAEISFLLEEKAYCNLYKKVPEFRKKKADRLKTAVGRAQSVGVWILLERMRAFYGLGEEAAFNLSHSGRYALCSVEDSGKRDVRLGCDIETAKHGGVKVADRFFCESEAAYIMSRETQEGRAEAFCRYWVLKESFMKAVRLGLKLDMRSFEIAFDDRNRPVLIRQPRGIGGTYFYREYSHEKIEAKIAVCSTEDCFGELKLVSLSDEKI